MSDSCEDPALKFSGSFILIDPSTLISLFDTVFSFPLYFFVIKYLAVSFDAAIPSKTLLIDDPPR